MRILMKPRSDACATRIFEIDGELLSHKLRMFGWWRGGNPLGFGLKYEHIINHYSHVYMWDGEKLRDIRNEILQHHKVNTGRMGISPSVLRNSDFTGRR
jgi:hypothetical protein